MVTAVFSSYNAFRCYLLMFHISLFVIRLTFWGISPSWKRERQRERDNSSTSWEKERQREGSLLYFCREGETERGITPRLLERGRDRERDYYISSMAVAYNVYLGLSLAVFTWFTITMFVVIIYCILRQ